MSQNLQFGGLRDGEGEPENRWPQLHERITSVKDIDLLLLQETWGWDKYGQKQLAQACNELNLEALPLPPSSNGNGPALLYRQETLGRWQRWNDDYSSKTFTGFGVAAFEIGLPSLLSVSSVHTTPLSSDLALQEMGLITTRAYRYGPFAIIGGDCNYAPAHGPDPDYSTMRPYNVAARTLLSDPANSERTPDRRQAWKLEQAGFVDVAWHMYQKTKDEKYLARTASDDRIDQFWVSQPLAPAIVDYQVIDEPKDASDHKGIAFQLDTELIDTANIWDYH
jgi:hypothetical protein